jgi:hypothetical protein
MDVITGKYGNSDERIARLGSRYSEVQNRVNEIMHIKNASVDTLAKEVLDGKFGTDDTRKKMLGNRYSEVQNRVNEIIKERKNKSKEIDGFSIGETYQVIATKGLYLRPNASFNNKPIRILPYGELVTVVDITKSNGYIWLIVNDGAVCAKTPSGNYFVG